MFGVNYSEPSSRLGRMFGDRTGESDDDGCNNRYKHIVSNLIYQSHLITNIK